MKRPFPSWGNEAAILAYAHVSDKIDQNFLHRLPLEVRVLVASARLVGERVVRVYWPTGEVAIMVCEPGSNMPAASRILDAFRSAKQSGSTLPAGGLSWAR